MRAFIRRHYRDLVNGLLFRPILITVLHAALAVLVVVISRHLEEPLFSRSADTTRAILTTIAGSSFTAVSIAFTVTIVTLQLVSDQFTPRALRGFLGRPWVQLVAGCFVGLVLYCLVALGMMRDGSEGGDHGLLAMVAVVLAIVALFVLLVFIHRISQSIQVSNIIADLVAETRTALDRHYAADDRAADGPRPEDDDGWPRVDAEEAGVVQSIDLDALLDLAADADVALRLAVQPGDFVLAGQALARFERGAPAGLEPHGGVAALRRAIVRQSQRDLSMDPAFGVRQLADIAARALSPGVNDPSTADHCLHWMTAIFAEVMARPRPTHRRLAAESGVVEVPLRPVARLLRTAFEEVAVYSADNPRMRRAVRRTLERLDGVTHPTHRPALAGIRRAIEASLDPPRDQGLDSGLEEGEDHPRRTPCDS